MFKRVPMGKGVEPVVAPEGDDYTVVVQSIYPGDEGKPDQLRLRIIGGDAPYETFQHAIWYPRPDDNPDQVASTVLAIRRLCHMFGVEYTHEGFDTDDFAGAEARGVKLRVRTYEKKDGTMAETNTLVLARIPEGE